MSGVHESFLRKVLRKRRGWVDAAVHPVLAAADEAVGRAVNTVVEWYEDRLDRGGRDLVDQTLHVLGWGLLAAVGTAAAAWAVAHHREFVRQAPIERIDDTERDMRFMLIGAAIGQAVHTTWTTCLVIALVRSASATWPPTPVLLP